MSAFHATVPPKSPLDPAKRVNYALGMVLGADDLTQEFAYLSARDQWATRDLHGYGTVLGLAVSTNGTEIVVAPGVAVSPRGQLIRVPLAQCAAIDDWLRTRTEDLNFRVQDGAVQLHVVLGFRECETDLAPIAGEPCRTADELMKPSRIADAFLLELSFDAPWQTEEDAIRDFVRWLREHLAISTTPGSSASLDDFLAAIDAAALAGLASPPPAPPASPLSPLDDFMLDSSPATPFTVFSGDLPRFLDAALRYWVKFLRGRWQPAFFTDRGNGSVLPGSPVDADRVLLATVTIPVTRELGETHWHMSDPDAIVVDDATRPTLVATRMLQELMLAGPGAAPAGSSAGYGVVAAGTVPLQGPPAAPALGNLRVDALDNAGATATVVTFAFDGAGTVAPGTQLVLKPVLVPAASLSDRERLNLTVDSVDPGARRFVLRVSRNGARIPDADLAQVNVMVEVAELRS
jgi:hypothetical protein